MKTMCQGWHNRKTEKAWSLKISQKDFPAVQWLLHAALPLQEGMGSIRGQGTKIPHDAAKIK